MTTAATRRRELLDEVTVGPRLEARLLDALALPPHADLLDVGAGDGRLLTRLRARGHAGRLVELDLHHVELPAAEWVVGRGEVLPFPGGSFEVVGFFQALLHVQEPEKALREAVRVLRSHGRVFVTSNGSGHLDAFWSIVQEAVGELPAWRAALPPRQSSLEDRLVNLLESSGLGVRVEFVSSPLQLAPLAALALLDTYRESLRVPPEEWEVGWAAAFALFRARGELTDRAQIVFCSADKPRP